MGEETCTREKTRKLAGGGNGERYLGKGYAKGNERGKFRTVVMKCILIKYLFFSYAEKMKMEKQPAKLGPLEGCFPIDCAWHELPMLLHNSICWFYCQQADAGHEMKHFF